MNLIRRIKKFFCLMAMFTIMVGIANVDVYAKENGAWIVTGKVSYANPEIGAIVDGGSNEALGDSMCQAIVDEKILVEIDGNKAYVTIGFGLASNISSVQIMVQNEAGGEEYTEVPVEETGRYEKDNDDCVQYRFEVIDPEYLISPVVFVDAMGRAVQFFVSLDMDSAAAGTGNYLSEMAGVAEPEGTEVEPETRETTAPESDAEGQAETSTAAERETVEVKSIDLEDTEGLRIYGISEENGARGDENNINLLIPVLAVVVIMFLVVAFIMIKKKGGK